MTYMLDYESGGREGNGYQSRYYHSATNDHFYYQQLYYSRNQSEDWEENDWGEWYDYESNHRRQEASHPTCARVDPK